MGDNTARQEVDGKVLEDCKEVLQRLQSKKLQELQKIEDGEIIEEVKHIIGRMNKPKPKPEAEKESPKWIMSADDWCALKGERILFDSTFGNEDNPCYLVEAEVKSVSPSGKYIQLRVFYTAENSVGLNWYNRTKIRIYDLLEQDSKGRLK